VDVRVDSPTFGEWEGFELTDENMLMLCCPVGFAHGFCVLSEVADVLYRQSDYYADATERGIAYNDPEVAIEWPISVDELVPSQLDAKEPKLTEIPSVLRFLCGGSRESS
jgi:dTDP-4-dehydrorhamnose 3,5-epimerase